jgi:D-lactate dehydrogenase
MKLAVFDTHKFEKEAFDKLEGQFNHELTYFEPRLTAETAPLAAGFPGVCAFANCALQAPALEALHKAGVKLIALRSAGYNHVDLAAAKRLGLTVVRVPRYSPYAVAEHAVGLLLALNRKIHKAYARVREQNFSLDGLVGFDLNGKTVGIIGTGQIGTVFAKILGGFGCELLAHDPYPNEQARRLGVRYVGLEELYEKSHVVSLHVPLLPETRHLIDAKALARMRQGVFLLNTGRGALIDAKALIEALKKGRIGGAGLDVYEEEENVFFKDLSGQILQDDTLARLLTFPNVLITSHQGFLTEEALRNIAQTTLQNASDFEAGRKLDNEVKAG